MKNMLNLCVFNTSIDPLKPPFVLGSANFEKLLCLNPLSYGIVIIKDSAVGAVPSFTLI